MSVDLAHQLLQVDYGLLLMGPEIPLLIHLNPHKQFSILVIGSSTMELIQLIPIAAIEYSLIYMLGGGGIVGALVIFLIAKMMRQ